MIDAVGTLSVQSSALRSLPQSNSALVNVSSSSSSSPNFISSRIRVDNLLDLAILEFRSVDTGDVIRQYPSESQIRAFQRASELEARRSESAERQARADALLQQSETQNTPSATIPASVNTNSAPTVSAAPVQVSTYTPPATTTAPSVSASTSSGYSSDASLSDSSGSTQSVTI